MPTWVVHFEPTVSHLSPLPTGGFAERVATPGTRVAPPAGSFPVVSAVRVHLTNDGAGAAPLLVTERQPATLAFIGRTAPVAGTVPPAFIVLGTVVGNVDFDRTQTPPVPRFTCGTIRNAATNSSTLNFQASTADEVARSDWILRIEKHPLTFDTNVVRSFSLRLPWVFNERSEKLQLSARLVINGTPHADETRNQVIDIPLVHLAVPEEADATKPKRKFIGVRNLYTRSNEHDSSSATAPVLRVPLANARMRVILHASFATFCTASAAPIPTVATAIEQILNDAGFGASVDVLNGPAADAECALHWRSVDGRFMSRLIVDRDQSKPERDRIEHLTAAAIAANRGVTVPNGMEQRIPFFDFYIFAEDSEPPAATELAHSERLVPVTGSVRGVLATTATKALATPIVIAKGFGATSPLRKLLAQIVDADHTNVLAGTVCHEIGHTLGLKHPIAFKGSLPYAFGDAEFARGTMSSGGLVTGSGPPRMALSFFGPVHQLEIGRRYR